jgi:hypothetical protein
MKKTNISSLCITVLFVFLLSSCACLRGNCPMMGKRPCQVGKIPCATAPVAGQTEMRKDVLYSCNCGPQCTCQSVSAQPGSCACGQAMRWGHVLKVEGNETLLCTCGQGCRCAIDPNDATKCGCGNPVKRVPLKVE